MPVLLIVDDDASVHQIFHRTFEGTDVDVVTSSSAADCLGRVSAGQVDVAVLNVVLPDSSGLETFKRIRDLDSKVPVVFVTAGGASETAIEAMKLGAFEYILKPLNIAQLRSTIARALEVRRLMQVPVDFRQSAQPADILGDVLVGRCPPMQEVYKAIGRVVSQDVTVLILGESGTGKELVARAIYQHSPRCDGPFLAVNCAAIPETLLESELFGHEKGAFTGAERKRIGKFEQCSGGTLFLDEIGDMSPVLQSKILRILQEQRFERIGGAETIKTDVRVIAATNRNLEQMVADGLFRADLYYRLNVFTIKLPPLRSRGEDLPILAEHYLRRFNREFRKEVRAIAPEALEVLMHYSWPGNIRELQSVLKQAMLQSTGAQLGVEALPESMRFSKRGSNSNRVSAALSVQPDIDEFIVRRLREGTSSLYDESVAMLERRLIARVLQHTGGNQLQAARILGLARGSLRKKIRLLGIHIHRTIDLDVDLDPAAAQR